MRRRAWSTSPPPTLSDPRPKGARAGPQLLRRVRAPLQRNQGLAGRMGEAGAAAAATPQAKPPPAANAGEREC
eukprot:10216190-Alexandrium_andersonii.AAC.1